VLGESRNNNFSVSYVEFGTYLGRLIHYATHSTDCQPGLLELPLQPSTRCSVGYQQAIEHRLLCMCTLPLTMSCCAHGVHSYSLW
jgi:hypothetical protein